MKRSLRSETRGKKGIYSIPNDLSGQRELKKVIMNIQPPNLFLRLYSVWFRHFEVYTKNLLSNGFPPFMEPIIFLAGIGLGLSKYIAGVNNMAYVQYLAIGLPLTSAMFTSAFECSFGTFVRLEFSKAYDGMLTGPLTVENLFIGEIIWAGTKGLFFSFAVLLVFLAFKIIPFTSGVLLIPFVGFLVGAMFSPLSLLYTSFIKDMNHLHFYISGLLTPMFMFSGIMFPVNNLPKWAQVIIYIFPLSHAVNMVRSVCGGQFTLNLLWNLIYCIVFIFVIGFFAVKRLRYRMMT